MIKSNDTGRRAADALAVAVEALERGGPFSGATWYSGQCANLALGIQKYLASRGVRCVVEMDVPRGPHPGGEHVRARCGRAPLDSRVFTPGSGVYVEASPDEIRAADIRVTSRRVDEVAATLRRLERAGVGSRAPVGRGRRR